MQDNNTCKASLDGCLLEGIISIRSAIDGGNRKIERVYIDIEKRRKRDRKITAFVAYLKAKCVDFELLEREKIDEMAGGNTHGGVVAKAAKRLCLSLDELLENAKVGDYFVYLDGIEDPYNLGYCIRTMYAMGAAGFILPEKSRIDGAVTARSSAGASELCKIAVAPSDVLSVEIIKNAGVDIVCSALSHTSVAIGDFRPDKPFVLFVGGEKRGISAEFMENADRVVHIPYAREDVRYSLPAASVCAIYAGALADYAKGKS